MPLPNFAEMMNNGPHRFGEEMRELKPRAWSRSHSAYCDFVTLDETGAWVGWFKRCGVFLADKDIVLELPTGLKDKNGRGLYEGDIVEALIEGVWNNYGGSNTVSFGQVKWNLEVIYNDIRFMNVFRVIGSRNAPDRIYYLFDEELSELEAIGNIHENPELLEGGKE